MASLPTLPAEMRTRFGKGAARATRRAGYVPGIIYGGDESPIGVQLRENVLHKAMGRGRFFSTLLELDLNGTQVRAIPRDMQYDVVRDLPIHVDFLRLSPRAEINVFVPVAFVNEEHSPGLRRGGVLNVVRHEVEIKVRAADIPSTLVVDVTGTDIGGVIHISAVPLPPGAKLAITDRDFAVATIASPSALAAQIREEQAAEAAAEAAEERDPEAVEGEAKPESKET